MQRARVVGFSPLGGIDGHASSPSFERRSTSLRFDLLLAGGVMYEDAA